MLTNQSSENSERNKYSILSNSEQFIYDSYLLLIYATYRIDAEQIMKNFLYICKDYHIQPSEIGKMPYYQYELYLEDIKAIQKEQEKENEKQQKDYSAMQSSMNPNKMMNSMNHNMGNMSLPKVNIPKF